MAASPHSWDFLLLRLRRAPTKLDNTQTGLIEIRQLDLVVFDIRVLANGKFN
jgi:hypothetical protein